MLYNRIDIALDPFPCTGGTTSMDTMWMGVPLITLAGEHFVSRMGVTILTNAGMPELIAQSRDEYIRLAVDLAQDKDRLRGLRHNLRDRVAASPLMNSGNFRPKHGDGLSGDVAKMVCGPARSPRRMKVLNSEIEKPGGIIPPGFSLYKNADELLCLI